MNNSKLQLDEIYPICKSILGDKAWEIIVKNFPNGKTAKSFTNFLQENHSTQIIPDYLIELSQLEWIRHKIKKTPVLKNSEQISINPSLEIFQSTWQLSNLFNKSKKVIPVIGNELLLIWKNPESDEIYTRAADDQELLALKIIAEDIELEHAAELAKVHIGKIYANIFNTINKKILLGPPPALKRTAPRLKLDSQIADDFIFASTFTLQWHITHACDLKCKHCYDRSKRSPLTLEQGIELLDELVDFCMQRNISGHVCFTGGNPYLSPYFFDLYQAATDRAFSTSILGNPVTRQQIEKLVAIQKPTYYQVSLEGLQPHSDEIRGKGHFSRVIQFLGILREFKVSSAIMLTLTKDNMNEILPLAEQFRGHVDRFTFNRLSQFGEGKNLLLPDKEEYKTFLYNYFDTSKSNPLLGFKDNLLNIILEKNGQDFFGGCTGFGCGAAFNFLAILPDGEAHACRKFPSPVGNVIENGLIKIYDSELAEKYRQGCSACHGCKLNHVCGGCLAISSSYNLNIFEERDPFCFIDS